jgi:hypothetical protein
LTLVKATIRNTFTNTDLTVMFNPEEYTFSKDVNFAPAAVPGLSSPLLQFVNGNLRTLELDLLVDTTEARGNDIDAGADVRPLVNRLTNLMDIDPERHAPPVLLFVWGASLSFTCVLARATQRFVMFKSDGTPVRARVQVTFNEYRNAELEAKEVKRETADYSKVHEVVQGDTLASIAAGAYSDTRQWRPIALRNGIDDPRTLTLGARLLIPPLPFLDPETGAVHG